MCTSNLIGFIGVVTVCTILSSANEDIFINWQIGIKIIFICIGYLIMKNVRDDTDKSHSFLRQIFIKCSPPYYISIIISFIVLHFLPRHGTFENLSSGFKTIYLIGDSKLINADHTPNVFYGFGAIATSLQYLLFISILVNTWKLLDERKLGIILIGLTWKSLLSFYLRKHIGLNFELLYDFWLFAIGSLICLYRSPSILSPIQFEALIDDGDEKEMDRQKITSSKSDEIFLLGGSGGESIANVHVHHRSREQASASLLANCSITLLCIILVILTIVPLDIRLSIIISVFITSIIITLNDPKNYEYELTFFGSEPFEFLGRICFVLWMCYWICMHSALAYPQPGGDSGQSLILMSFTSNPDITLLSYSTLCITFIIVVAFTLVLYCSNECEFFQKEEATRWKALSIIIVIALLLSRHEFYKKKLRFHDIYSNNYERMGDTSRNIFLAKMVNYAEGMMKANDHMWPHSGCKFSDFHGVRFDPPEGLCTLPVGRFGKFDILVIGNGYAANQADTIYQSFKHMAKSFRIFSIDECNALDLSDGTKCPSENLFKRVVEEFRPEILFISNKYLSLALDKLNEPIRFDPVYQNHSNLLQSYLEVDSLKKIYVVQAHPVCKSHCATTATRVVNKEQRFLNTSPVDAFLLPKDNTTLKRLRISTLVKTCRICEIIDYMPALTNKDGTLFRIFSGYGIGRLIGRTHIFRIDDSCREANERELATIRSIFPGLSRIILTDSEYTLSDNSTFMIFASYHGHNVCCHFEDPTWRLLNITEEHIQLNKKYVQNALYFQKHIAELMEMLKFSSEVTKNGDGIIAKWNVEAGAKFSCMHIRRTDHWAKSDFNFSVAGLQFMLDREKFKHFIIFGDDEEFMKSISIAAKRDNSFNDTTIIVNTNKLIGEDLYISSKLCHAFLMTVPESTFGWFLAFFSNENDHVYFDHNMMADLGYYSGFHRDAWKPLTWNKESTKLAFIEPILE